MTDLFHSFFRKTKTLEERVVEAQNGNNIELQSIITEYKPFVIKTASTLCKRKINPINDDEFSIALIGLNEAIAHFEYSNRNSFLAFAKLIINRRLIDFIRKESKQSRNTNLDDHSDNSENHYEATKSNEHYLMLTDEQKRSYEILSLKETLKEYGISFLDLKNNCPKHFDARIKMMKIAKLIVSKNELKEPIFTKKKIPIKELIQHVDTSKKTIERNRKYLIALVVVLESDYSYIKDYLKGVGL